MAFSLRERAVGVLLHPSSLPGPYGVGDLGPEASRFARFLAAAGQRWWQMLPVGPPGAGNSPYHSLSAFAGNPLLLSLERLAREGLLEPGEIEPDTVLDAGARAAYAEARAFKEPRLRRAWGRFGRGRGRAERAAFDAFRERSGPWLEPYALFAALRRAHGGAPWTDWGPALRGRRPAALRSARRALAREFAFERFLQFEFSRQWRSLREECRSLGVGLIGDLPLFVSGDGADAWARRELFLLDENGRPPAVAGAPPDYFSASGQLWGNPLYDWEALRRDGYAWWVARLAQAARRFDASRLDHFIGFTRCWEVPAGARSAAEGRYAPGPGAPFFEAALQRLGPLELIAEDLGAADAAVRELRDRFDLPGMRVLQFAFGSAGKESEHAPEKHPKRCVVYTGTHDNDTTVGWFRAAAPRVPGVDGAEIHWHMIGLAYRSAADTAIVPVQDLLGLGSEARMNRPGTAEGNWEWRLAPGRLTPELAARLRGLAASCGRLAGRDIR